MLKASRYRFLLAAAACLVLARPLISTEGVTGNLVDVNWLQKHLNDARVLILDASPTPIYAANHIPGAISVDLFATGLPETSAAGMERLYRSWGLSSGKTVVVYDQGGTMLASRVFFSLCYFGVPTKNLFILDGGLSKWQGKGLPVTKDSTPISRQGSFKIGKLNEDVKVELPEFLTASGDTANNVLLEALGADWHFGQVAPFGRAGHIPNGILLPSSDFYNPDKTFKSAEDIQRMLTYLGIGPEQRIYTYCGGGVAASVPFFALKFILKYPRVKLYVGSELGWLSDERELPYWTYDAPFLMRATSWLQCWSGQRIRMFLSTHVTIVDVRPAEAFNRGHVPFALNIPADVFRSNIASPGKLAGILGPAGVDASEEAVIISGAGLTKDSALAFAMLEKLGQKKASIFMDSMDKWTQLGFHLTKDATIVGPRKGRMDVSIPPTAYPRDFRKDVIVVDPNTTHGSYPKVFIASGKDVPAKAQDGTVVHIPYTALLNAGGTPKAAKDIWTILTKAGVPRYAELVCYSDDPGEAAVNYFILRLMGYPDIKVLVI
jgi:thiosulfate/3-mercaptopyruvate sulfurtransferase